MSNEARIAGFSERERSRYIERLTDELPVLRTKLGLSQDELASLLDVSRQTYSSIERKRRKMSWTLYLSLILLLDNNSQTHDLLRHSDLFPQKLFQRAEASITDQVLASFSEHAGNDVRNKLDEQAIHAIETVIMVEYARCNNMSSEAVIKAFEGLRLTQPSARAVKAKDALRAIRSEKEEA